MVRSLHSRRPATLASLAAELGVSRTTVSNAYNRPDQLSPELRRRVLETARKLGYPGPDPVARSLRTRKAGAVGLLLTENLSYAFRDPAAIGFLEGLALACEDAKQGLHLVPANPEREDVAAVHRAGVDGFVVKDTPARQLADAVRRVHRGLRVVDPLLAADSAAVGESPLTPRETEVLRCSLGGATVAAIARQLVLSEGTVRNHLSGAIGKTGATTRAEAARIARDNGWL